MLSSWSLSTSIPLPPGSLGHHKWFHSQFPPFSLFSTALWDLANPRPVHSLILSSHLFCYLPCLLLPFTVPCKMLLARPDELETCPYHCSLRLFTMVGSSCGPVACWILTRTSRSLYMRCVVSCGSTLFSWLVFFFGALLLLQSRQLCCHNLIDCASGTKTN